MHRRTKGLSQSAYKRAVARRQRRFVPKSLREQYPWREITRRIPTTDHEACAQILIRRFDATSRLNFEDRWDYPRHMYLLLSKPTPVILALKALGRHDVVASINEYAQWQRAEYPWGRGRQVPKAPMRVLSDDPLAAELFAEEIEFAALTIEERALRLCEWAAAPNKPLGGRIKWRNSWPLNPLPTLLNLLQGSPADILLWLNEHGHQDVIQVIIDSMEAAIDLEDLDAKLNDSRRYKAIAAPTEAKLMMRATDQYIMCIARPFVLAAKKAGFAVKWAEEKHIPKGVFAEGGARNMKVFILMK